VYELQKVAEVLLLDLLRNECSHIQHIRCINITSLWFTLASRMCISCSAMRRPSQHMLHSYNLLLQTLSTKSL